MRIRYNGKYVSIYGKTKAECYEKLKVIADKVEQEKWLAKLAGITATPIVQAVIAQAPPTPTVKVYTLQEWFDEWLTSYKGNLRAVTVNGYRQLFKTHCADLLDTSVTEITNAMLARVVNTMSGCRQAKDQVKSLLKQLFAIAHNDKLIDSNPTLNLPRPKATPPTRKRQALTAEQEKRFIETALSDLDKYEPLLVCVLQGIRKGELLALRPNDFNFKENTLRIDESYDHNYPDDLMTKNSASVRTMPMFDLTKQLLLKYKDTDPIKRVYEHIHGATLNLWLGKLLKKNGLPRMTLHELRHTFITRCHEKGIDELIIQKWVGHAKGSRMRKAVYTHINDEDELKSIELLNKTA